MFEIQTLQPKQARVDALRIGKGLAAPVSGRRKVPQYNGHLNLPTEPPS